MSTILPYGPGLGQWDTIKELLQSAANYDFASGQKMTIKGTVCGNVANASSIQGNGNYSNTGTVGGIQLVGPTGPIHSTYNSQPFDCQWFTVLPPACPSPPNETSDQLFVDIATASNTAKALTPTQTFAGIDTNIGNVTINVVSGLNVINVPPNPYGTTEGKLQVRGNGDLIISGPSDAVVIFNVGADNEVNAVRNGMDILNGRSILTIGGVQAQNILFNVLGGDITVNGGVVNGNILVRAGSDVKGKADIQGTTRINGIVIGDGTHSSEFSLAEGAIICGAFASITVEKEVSSDNGTTWFDADIPPGPNIASGTNPQFRYIVTNTGNLTLSNITLVDSVLGPITIPTTTLAPGGTFTVNVVGTWGAGQNTNIATVTGQNGTITVTDTDPANYVGIVTGSSIDVEKLVSPDGGTTFDDADIPPGSNIPAGTNPVFRYIVVNNGDITLTGITLTDSVLGPITIPTTTLASGTSFTVDVTGTWVAGPNNNVATVTGTDGVTTVTDTDVANYVGVVVAPSIDIEKLVSPDGGATFDDADTPTGPNIVQGTNPVFRYVVANTGNVTLTNATLTDSILGPITIPTTLVPGATFTVDVTGTWAAGQNTTLATVNALSGTVTVSDTDPANYFGTPAVPTIDLEKLVSADNGLTFDDADIAPGPDVSQTTNPVFRFIVTNTGNVTLTNIVLTDSVIGSIATPVTTLLPSQSFTVDKTGVWTIGEQVNTATATGRYENVTVIDTDPAHYVGIIVPTNFKQLSIDENLTIPSQKPDAEDILNTLVDVVIIETRVIKTLKGTSQEGQILTGYKLIIEGVLHQKVEYIADEPTQTVHVAEFSVPFSSFIILPENFVEGSIIEVTPYVEDVYVKLLNKRDIFKNVTLRLEVAIIN